MLSIFKPSPLLDENTEAWLIDAFLWAFDEFDGIETLPTNDIVLPTKAFFPDAVSSVHNMAEQVFKRVLNYSQMQAWPLQLVSPSLLQQKPFPQIVFQSTRRGSAAQLVSASHAIDVSYNPNQINQPQDLVASFAQTLSYIQILHRGAMPPGGEQYMDAAVEVLASFMGFGVMLSNTAYQFKGGCGSCYNPYANRKASLGEYEHVYLLAMLSAVKNGADSDIRQHLKPHLRSVYKKAVKQFKRTVKESANPALLALTQRDVHVS